MRYFVAAVLLHLVLLAVVLVGVYFHPVRRPEPVIEAILVSPKPPKAAAQTAATTPDVPKPEPKVEPKPEPKPDPKPDLKQAEEKKLKEQQIAQQKQAELQRKVEQEKALKLQQERELQEKKRLEAEKKLKQMEEQEHKKQLEEEEKRQKQEQDKRQKELEQQRQQDLSEMLNKEQEGRTATETSRWIALITDKIRRNWIRPINSIDNFQCKLFVQILPGGSVVNVKMTESCGSSVLDESVKRAVLKSDPLPMPTDPSVFDRNLNFTFIPKTK